MTLDIKQDGHYHQWFKNLMLASYFDESPEYFDAEAWLQAEVLRMGGVLSEDFWKRGAEASIYFERDADATMFLLRWA